MLEILTPCMPGITVATYFKVRETILILSITSLWKEREPC